ncbi:MAG: ROK family protein [Candidatus Aminicenantes bacterium]|nr:ROK family protein [Candidatus Aminicenantes bacterium]
MERLGIDIGGSGVKGAPVDLKKGDFARERLRIPTPEPSSPKAVAAVVKEITDHFKWDRPIGCTFPAVIKKGIACSAANVDPSWLGTDGETLIREVTGCPTLFLNDADAAGIAEMEYGAGKGRKGVVIMLTFGTGIGSAVFIDGVLVPNTEFGHMEVRGKDAEHRASARIRKEKKLGWKKWAIAVNEFLRRMEILFSPDLFIFGGGVSRRHEYYFSYLKTKTEILPAILENRAGIIGAALAAYRAFK